MAESNEPQVVKVEVQASIGMSVQTSHGDWIKQSSTLTSHVSGHPDSDMLERVANDMTIAAYNQCATQIQLVVEKVNADIQEALKR